MKVKMCIVNDIYRIVTDSIAEIRYEENFESYRISFTAKKYHKLDYEFINKKLNSLWDGDVIKFNIVYLGESIGIFESGNITSMEEEWNEIYNEPDEIKIDILIEKENKDYVKIYNIAAFAEYLDRLSISRFLEKISDIKEEKYCIKFLTKEYSYVETDTIIISDNIVELRNFSPSNVKREEIIKSGKEVANISKFNTRNLLANDFYIKKCSDVGKIEEIFNKVCLILILSYIANYSELNEEKYYYRILGYKVIEEEIYFKELKVKKNVLETYFSIYQWIYISVACSDRCGIARNIISLYEKNGYSDLDASAYAAILSSYEVYLKSNVNQYLEVKHNVAKDISSMNERMVALSSSFASRLRNNLLTLISFYVTTIVINTISTGKIVNIFTKDIVILSYVFFACSLIYYIVCLVELFLEKKGYKHLYERQKGMYADVLSDKDIDNIYMNNKPFEEDNKNVNIVVMIYSLLWFGCIIGTYIAVNYLKL